MQTKALSYLRISSVGQTEGDGFDRQRDIIQRYARGQGIKIIQEFTDSVSGNKETPDRPGLSALLQTIASNGVHLILVEKADRFARDLIVSEMLLAEIRKVGCHVIACDSGTDLTANDGNATTVLIRQVLGAVAQFEKSALVIKLRAARDRIRRREGRCEGRKRYGTLPGEAEALRRIKELYRKPRQGNRRSLAQIAKILDAEKIHTRTGKSWNRGSVWAILKRKDSPIRQVQSL